MIQRIFLLLVVVISFSQLQAQDVQLTQMYSSPVSINPGFTGATEANRFSVINRHQWINLKAPLRFYGFYFDRNVAHMNSGFGVYANHSSFGQSGHKQLTAGFLYSYTIHLSEKVKLVPGLNFGYGQRSLDFDKLLFGDQISENGNSATNEKLPASDSKSYFDFSAGAALYNKSAWFGISVSHLNKPNISFTNYISHYPRMYSAHGGYKFEISRRSIGKTKIQSISPVFKLKAQESSTALDLGIYWANQPVIAGIWYRGIPVSGDQLTFLNQSESLSFLLGFSIGKSVVAYSYDYTISSLGISSSGGSHEISISMEFGKQRTKKRKRNYYVLPCPKF